MPNIDQDLVFDFFANHFGRCEGKGCDPADDYHVDMMAHVIATMYGPALRELARH